MLFKFPKNDANYYWTQHSKTKMLQYRISEQKIKAVLKNPARKEDGIAPKTIAVMKRNDTPKRKQEIWVMYLVPQSGTRGITRTNTRNYAERKKLKIISAWRYPGISPKGKRIEIPEDTLKELELLK